MNKKFEGTQFADNFAATLGTDLDVHLYSNYRNAYENMLDATNTATQLSAALCQKNVVAFIESKAKAVLDLRNKEADRFEPETLDACDDIVSEQAAVVAQGKAPHFATLAGATAVRNVLFALLEPHLLPLLKEASVHGAQTGIRESKYKFFNDIIAGTDKTCSQKAFRDTLVDLEDQDFTACLDSHMAFDIAHVQIQRVLNTFETSIGIALAAIRSVVHCEMQQQVQTFVNAITVVDMNFLDQVEAGAVPVDLEKEIANNIATSRHIQNSLKFVEQPFQSMTASVSNGIQYFSDKYDETFTTVLKNNTEINDKVLQKLAQATDAEKEKPAHSNLN